MLIAPDNTLIAVAANLEWPHFHETLAGWRLAQTGIGKVNALTKILTEHQHQPFTVLVNLGSVGANSKDLKIGEILQATDIRERDNPFGQGPIELPKLISPEVSTATLGTGDSFAEKENLPSKEIAIVDMEGYAIARLAETLKLKCLLLKVVSDYCTSFADWEQNVSINSKKLAEFFVSNKFKL